MFERLVELVTGKCLSMGDANFIENHLSPVATMPDHIVGNIENYVFERLEK